MPYAITIKITGSDDNSKKEVLEQARKMLADMADEIKSTGNLVPGTLTQFGVTVSIARNF